MKPHRIANRRYGTVLATLLVWVFASGYSSSALFETPAGQGGGNGLFYTGSPTAHGMHCGSCHQGDVQATGVTVTADPAGLFSKGYEPGKVYTLDIAIDAEKRGLDKQGGCDKGKGGCNRNGFVAELVGDNGSAVGTLCADGGTIDADGCDQTSGKQSSLMGKGAAVGGHSLELPVVCAKPGDTNCFDMAKMQAEGKSSAEISAALKAAIVGRTSWRFMWRAPAGTGPVNLFLGVVDGDGGATVDPHHNDYVGDSVLLVQRRILREGEPDHAWPDNDIDPHGCGAVPASRGKFPTAPIAAIFCSVFIILNTRWRSRT